MKRPEEFIGKKFGKLLVVAGRETDKLQKTFYAYHCLCDCGKTIDVNASQLIRGTKSCGCLRIFSNLTDKLYPGFKINRLTVIDFSYKEQKWQFKCDCGNTYFATGKYILSENAKSCGCLNTEKSRAKAIDQINKRSNPNPIEVLSNSVYKSRYKDGNLTYDDFFKLSQQPCFYCEAERTNKVIKTPSQYSFLSKLSQEELTFRYNGIDRISSKEKPHNLDNCVAACYKCNHAKSDMTINDFIKYLEKLTTDQKPISFNDYKQSSDDIDISFFKDTDKNYSFINSITFTMRLYNDVDFDLKTFYQLSQLNCYYCGSGPLNLCNRAKQKGRASEYAISTGNFKYNGLDRIDPTLPHLYSNIIPACRFCNFAKNNLSISEFYDWIERIKINLQHLQQKLKELNLPPND